MVYFASKLNELKVVLIKPTFVRLGCGKTGIRTLGTRKGTTVFETVPIDHSGIFPRFARTKLVIVLDVVKQLRKNIFLIERMCAFAG